MTMPHLMNCAHSEDGWCLDCVEELWNKTQIPPVPPEMLESATGRYMLNIGYSEQAVKMHRQDKDAAWQNNQRHTQLILEAAGVPALVARIAELEQRETRILETIETEGFPLRPELAQFFDDRIAYFTAQESPRNEAVALAWSDYLIEVLKRVMNG